ncbi:D-amino acid aminotransferase [Thiomicrorhabdus sp.]|uniref:D-amino acid aminotransferase n=1 Tax=Thiomicrorhabdus sp. TaxID=2039724 RepID=UPI0029C68A92|nr:D-amino acid aminotransferase [Thiomicrorhabdus sp.]
MSTSHAHEQHVYLNGEFLPMIDARISTQDRGFLFGDGIYEVIPVYQRKLFCFAQHLQRLKNSLQAVSIVNPLTDQEWLNLFNELIARHPWEDQFIYLQITRGIQMQRDHMPADCLQPTIYAYTNPLKPVAEHILQNGIQAITLEDIRWMRCDIKAITLLPNVMMKLAAKSHGADDALLIGRDGYVNEGTASNVFVVKNGILFTPPNGTRLLPGVTRLVIERIAQDIQLPLQEIPISEQALQEADEIWLSSSTKEALPVTRLNGEKVGTGKPGPVWHTMRDHYQQTKTTLLQQDTV